MRTYKVNDLWEVLEDRDITDFSELSEVEKEDMHRFYPRADIGEGWFGRECAEEILKEYFNKRKCINLS